MDELVGLNNAKRVYDLTRQLRLSKTSKGRLTIDSMAALVLQYMAISTYDWPPHGKAEDYHLACRYYDSGVDSIIDALGLAQLSADELLGAGVEDGNRMRRTRWDSARKRVTRTLKFLEERGLIKRLHGASNKIAVGYQLMLGDDAENEACEQWNRKASDFFKIKPEIDFGFEDDGSEWAEPDSD